MALNYKAIGRRLRVARLVLGRAERDFARVAAFAAWPSLDL
jgi:hypothetical protein